MDKIGEILLGNSRTKTNTEISNPSSYDVDNQPFDRTKDTGITRALAQAQSADLSLPIAVCKTCGEPNQKDIEIEPLGRTLRVGISCRCMREESKKDEERFAWMELQRRLEKFRMYSLMDERFTESTFEKWVFRDDNRSLYDFGKRYCSNWDTVYANNRGLLIHGKAGNGKTFLSFAIANELYRMGKAVLAISVSRILKVIMDSYGNHGDLGEIDVLNTLGAASLLILDDLGVEYKTQWAYEKLYSIIDSRYKAKKPTIITTNLAINDLRDNLSIVDSRTGQTDQSGRIYNRIVEMCALIEVEGESWRTQKGEENQAALFKELGLVKG